jgi:hypothetical protein
MKPTKALDILESEAACWTDLTKLGDERDQTVATLSDMSAAGSQAPPQLRLPTLWKYSR